MSYILKQIIFVLTGTKMLPFSFKKIISTLYYNLLLFYPYFYRRQNKINKYEKYRHTYQKVCINNCINAFNLFFNIRAVGFKLFTKMSDP